MTTELMEQMNFFEMTENLDLLNKLLILEEKQANLRRGIFGRFDKMVTQNAEMEEKLDLVMKHLDLSKVDIVEQKIVELPLFAKEGI